MSISEVTLRPQVAGSVLDAPSGEGHDVKAGDVVLRLDARPFDATLKEAQAALVRHQALATDAHRAAEALKTALTNRATSEREAEAAEANAVAADAQIVQDQATIETAQLNLAYCTITAPFAGRLGALMVKPGAVVKEKETDLITITQIAPIEVGFSLPEQSLGAVRAAQEAGPVPVQAVIPGEMEPAKGELSFIDNKVDTLTGAFRMKARFENADRRLWPGEFVNVTITVGLEKAAVVVPAAAVQASQKGQSVFVVKPDQTVDLRYVKARVLMDTSIIESGVQAGETVVTDGQLRLVPGTKIAPKGPALGGPAVPAGSPSATESKRSEASAADPAGTAGPPSGASR
jgi:multidrug efflux system membrane fusion protein